MKGLPDPAVAMDSIALIRRASELGIELQSYDPNRLVVEVEELLHRHGLSPDQQGRAGMAVGAAGTLLRALGILPAGDHRTIDRPNAPDADDR
jgi:hypothetical protein